MSTTSDKVVIEEVWKLRDQATPQVRLLRNEVRMLGNQMAQTKGNLWSMAGSAMALTVAVAGTARLGKSVIKVSDELERMKYGMGAILLQAQKLGFASLGLKDMNDALREGGNLYQRLFIYSQKAVGTADDYVNAWRDIGQAVLQAGGSMAQTEQITQLLVPLTKQFGILAESGARDVRQMLMGQMTQRDVIPRMLGITNVEEVNQRMSMMQRLNLLIEKMETGRAGTKAYESTFGAQWDTFKSLIVQMQRVGGEGFFEQVKRDLKAFNDMFLGNEKRVYEYAKRIANEMKDAYTTVRDAVVWVTTHFREIVATSKIILGIWLSMKIASRSIAMYQSANEWIKAMGGWQMVRATSNLSEFVKGIGLLGPAIAGATFAVLIAIDQLIKAKKEYDAGKESGRRKEATIDAQVGEAFALVQQHQQTIADLKEEFKYAPENFFAETRNRKTFTSMEWARMDLAALQEAKNVQRKSPYLTTLSDDGSAVSGTHRNYKELAGRDFNNLYYLAMKKQIDTALGFDPTVMAEPTVTDPPKVDFRGSHITINVDSRHADPNRVAATVIGAIGRMARSKTGGRGGMAGAATVGG